MTKYRLIQGWDVVINTEDDRSPSRTDDIELWIFHSDLPSSEEDIETAVEHFETPWGTMSIICPSWGFKSIIKVLCNRIKRYNKELGFDKYDKLISLVTWVLQRQLKN